MAKRKAGSRRKKPASQRTASRRAKSSRTRATRKAAGPRRKTKKLARKASRPAARRTSAATRRQAQGRSQQRKPTKKRPAMKAARPKPPALQRERRRLDEGASPVSLPSTLNFDRKASSASSGREALKHQRRQHTEAGPAFTGGDVDADWEDGYSEGDEAPGGDNPTPDQDVVEEIGRALGVEYDDAEELKGADKITERDTNRWEYDPASAEDYRDRNKKDQ
jgi:uncharacterized protein DUF6335